MDWPLAFFFTWTCYGQRLHGDTRGSVDRFHNRFGTPFHSRNDGLRDHEFSQLAHAPTLLTAPMRRVVRDSIAERCTFMGTPLVALNVRTTHVHLIVKAEEDPGKVMGGFKSRSTRALRDSKLAEATTHVWTDRGSKRWLFTLDALREAMEYVLLEQGVPDEFVVRGDGY